ncbi:MAG: hypothetical protein WA973_15555 [Mesorhizobium sp.]|uniref:BPL/LPL catalytic domain-containing protein n=1 Tax=Aquamicrobium soli TaxID=1811518 RepID=A0ABV7KKF3_9HYPH
MYTFLDIARAIQSESAMLDAVASGKERFQFLLWQSAEPCLVVPRRMTNLANFAEASIGALNRGYPVSVRETGGGAVIQASGTVNVSIAFTMPMTMDDRIGHAYKFLCEPVMQFLRQQGADPAYGTIEGAMCDGAYNIVVNQRKLAGTAQRWRRARANDEHYAVLAHLVLSVDTDHASTCRVVNEFHAAVGVATNVRPESHINWTEIASPVGLDAAITRVYLEASAAIMSKPL